VKDQDEGVALIRFLNLIMRLEAFQHSETDVHILLIVGLASGVATNGENPKRYLSKSFLWS